MVSFELGKEIKDVFSSCHEHGTKKKLNFVIMRPSSPWSLCGSVVRASERRIRGSEVRVSWKSRIKDDPWSLILDPVILDPVILDPWSLILDPWSSDPVIRWSGDPWSSFSRKPGAIPPGDSETKKHLSLFLYWAQNLPSLLFLSIRRFLLFLSCFTITVIYVKRQEWQWW